MCVICLSCNCTAEEHLWLANVCVYIEKHVICVCNSLNLSAYYVPVKCCGQSYCICIIYIYVCMCTLTLCASAKLLAACVCTFLLLCNVQ